MRPPGGASVGHPETSQLLVIVSDGRGLFLEGMEIVKNAVRAARDANIFLMFVVIDNPENKVRSCLLLKGKFSSVIEGALASTLNRDFN